MRRLLVFIVIFSSSCKRSIDLAYIKTTGWSYSEGYRITDFMVFDRSSGYTISGDTILFGGKPRGKIVSLDKRNFDLTIVSLDGQMKGHYMDEKEMLK
jgi:hypothetical protein